MFFWKKNNLGKHRKFPIGAEILSEGVNFRVYASEAEKVDVALENPLSKDKIQFYELHSEGNGYFSGTFDAFSKGSLYRFRLDNGEFLYPDPASRFQPEGPFGPSQVINNQEYLWTDQNWKGVPIEGQIIYEMHIGTFTEDGTFAAARKELPELANLGITVIEVMPVADFYGNFGWGYDGVNLFAPTRLYGTPDDLKDFVDEAHRLNIAVILDVVYNHFGPEGNFIGCFSKDYFSEKLTDWGQAVNYDNSESRLFFLTNVRYWISEYHFDGLRLDATHSIFSNTPVHILKDICLTAKKESQGRHILVIGEDESQRSILIKPIVKGGYGLDAVWNDDFHHVAMVRLTGRREAYYSDYLGKTQELLSCLKYGFLYQGQYYVWQKKIRGSPCLDLPRSSFIFFLQNHDQIANSGLGLRVHHLTDTANFRAMTCLFLIVAEIPMLFQGQEFASSSPFFYFADNSPNLESSVWEGRKEFLSQFRNLGTEKMQALLKKPSDPKTFIESKIDLKEREKNASIYKMHKDLIKLRKTDPVFSKPKIIDGAILNEDSFVIRFFAKKGMARLLFVNFGADYELAPASEPLLAPEEGCDWKMLWNSESMEYGGQDIPPIANNAIFPIAGRSAIILASQEKKETND